MKSRKSIAFDHGRLDACGASNHQPAANKNFLRQYGIELYKIYRAGIKSRRKRPKKRGQP